MRTWEDKNEQKSKKEKWNKDLEFNAEAVWAKAENLFKEKWQHFWNLKSFSVLWYILWCTDIVPDLNIIFATEVENWESNIKMNPKFCKHWINKPSDEGNNPRKYDFKWEYPWWEIHYKWNIVYLSDIWNVLYGYLWACIWFSYKHIENAALTVTKAAWDDGAKKEWVLQNELRDRPYYKMWYSLWRSYPPDKLRKDLIISSLLSVNPYKYEEKTEE